MSANADLEILRCREAAKGRDDHKTQPIFVIRLRPIHGDGVRGLRQLLKFALRACRLRAVSVTKEAPKPEVMPS